MLVMTGMVIAARSWACLREWGNKLFFMDYGRLDANMRHLVTAGLLLSALAADERATSPGSAAAGNLVSRHRRRR